MDEETLARMNQWQELEPKKDVPSPHKAQHDGNESSTWSAIYDSEDIWDEHGGFTDELLSEIPSMLSSIGTCMDDDDDEQEGACPLVPEMQQPEEDANSTAITASVVPPTATPYLSQTLRRKQPSQSQDSTIENNNKKPRHDEDATTDASTVDKVKDDDQSGDDWGPENDELWLTIAELASPFV